MKICVECKHYRRGFLENPKFGKCAATPDREDDYRLVTGSKRNAPSYCRVARLESQPCGPEGKLWEAK